MKRAVRNLVVVTIFNFLPLFGLAGGQAQQPQHHHPCKIEELSRAIEDWESDDIEVRGAASKVARDIVKKELVRIENKIREQFPIIVNFEQFDEIEARRKELEERSCVFQLLREALKSSDPEVRARAKDAVRPPPSPLDEAIFSLED
jgi:hypothetical protein